MASSRSNSTEVALADSNGPSCFFIVLVPVNTTVHELVSMVAVPACNRLRRRLVEICITATDGEQAFMPEQSSVTEALFNGDTSWILRGL